MKSDFDELLTLQVADIWRNLVMERGSCESIVLIFTFCKLLTIPSEAAKKLKVFEQW